MNRIVSQYFRVAFSNKCVKKDGKFILSKQNIKLILFLGLDVLNLLDDLDIHSLITYIQEYLIEHQTENSTGIHEIVYQHESFTNLWNSCIEKIYILPQDLIHDPLEFHIVPNKKLKTNKSPSRKSNLKFKLDSNLIESNHVPFFAYWIDKKELHIMIK
ncbi:BTB/POZ protein [Rhizophagus clarus]|uniref:BTB/POZ protein n=1 Tax=Rhizophagus clarus TaxID=94130 RepID=A0A8H3LL43_9GLOM|nr:BTB/POZ protein [Rhizophagus clarus]